MARSDPESGDPAPRRSDRPRHRGYRPIKGQGSIQAGVYWSQQVTSMSVGLILPVLAGWWADTQFDTEPWLLVIGAILGFVLLMTRLIQMITPPTDVTGTPNKSTPIDNASEPNAASPGDGPPTEPSA